MTTVRAAAPGDAAAAAAAVDELLGELDGERPAAALVEEAARELIEDGEAGALLLAEAEGEVVGLLAASWQLAIHVPGRYATIQDLWVRRDRRGEGVGRELVEALTALARERGLARLEVGLPSRRFAALAQTERFYADCGFEPLGPRMRMLLNGAAAEGGR